MSWSADTLEQKYGSVLREPPYSDAGTPRQLFRMLEQQKPRDKISEGVCKSWFGKYLVARESSANTAQEFEERYGDRARPLIEEHNSAYKLTKALLALDPPVCISDQVAKTWLSSYQGLRHFETAGQLESEFGERIRSEKPEDVASAHQLLTWVSKQYSIRVSLRVAQNWMTAKWGRGNVLYTPEDVEESLGERLRLPQFRVQFESDAGAEVLSERLEESQPSVSVSGLLLRQWCAKFHPGGGPLQFANAEELEAGLGDRLRDVYAGLHDGALQTVLGAARKAVEVSHRTCRTWLENFGPGTVKKRPASKVLKRPAAKRSSSSSSSAPSSLVRVVGNAGSGRDHWRSMSQGVV